MSNDITVEVTYRWARVVVIYINEHGFPVYHHIGLWPIDAVVSDNLQALMLAFDNTDLNIINYYVRYTSHLKVSKSVYDSGWLKVHAVDDIDSVDSTPVESTEVLPYYLDEPEESLPPSLLAQAVRRFLVNLKGSIG